MIIMQKYAEECAKKKPSLMKKYIYSQRAFFSETSRFPGVGVFLLFL